jgi:hypothetical protein
VFIHALIPCRRHTTTQVDLPTLCSALNGDAIARQQLHARTRFVATQCSGTVFGAEFSPNPGIALLLCFHEPSLEKIQHEVPYAGVSFLPPRIMLNLQKFV